MSCVICNYQVIAALANLKKTTSKTILNRPYYGHIESSHQEEAHFNDMWSYVMPCPTNHCEVIAASHKLIKDNN